MDKRPQKHLTFGCDINVEMDKVQRRRESWRRSSRKYRATKKVEQLPWLDSEERQG